MTAEINNISGNAFDFIIIGGGTAGLCIAARLTEDASLSVLVLESGEANLQDPAILLPGTYGSHLGNPKYDWLYSTVEQPHCADRKIYWPRGKGLGGSSAINFFNWSNPSKKDIDAFEALGNPGWNWDSYVKYARRAEGFVEPVATSDVISYDVEYHGVKGPIRTCFSGVVSGLEKPVKDAMQNLGVRAVKDSASGFVSGAGTFSIPNSIDPATYTRSYSANAYYEPNAARSNLTVLVSAHVAQILTDPNNDGTITATGVRFLHGGSLHEVIAKREVILSAGAINSPQILELSGIGSSNVLSKAGIELKLELPGVGNNVQDHYYFGIPYELTDDAAEEFFTFDSLRDPEIAKKELALHAERKGLHTMAILTQTFLPLSAMSTSAGRFQKALIDKIEANMKEGLYPQGLEKQYKLQIEHLKDQWPSAEIITLPGYSPGGPNPPMAKKKYLTLCACLNHPFSRGSIHVTSNNPLTPPAIDPAVFAEPYDLMTLVEIVKFIRKVAKEEPLKSVLAQELNPGTAVETDEEIAEYVKAVIGTTFHTIGSASMLPLEDGGVVDSELKVHKTTNIRVADTSIAPLHIGAHTQALAYAIGEKAADIIKGVV